MSTITPEEQARCAERVRERDASAAAAEQYREEHPDGGDCEPTLEPADELEWLREQYVVLKQNNDSLRQAYSAVGQEASALRRALVSRAPTLRERAALAALPECMRDADENIEAYRITGDFFEMNSKQIAVYRACQYADALIKELANG